MRIERILPDIIAKNDKKILLVVLDGLGGFPNPETGLTELETAATPNLDKLAQEASCGTIVPIETGVTPGSGPAHLGLFGYDPVEYQIGRGVLEVLGIGMTLGADDLAIRGNFASIDKDRTVTDRRAGRIPTEESAKLVELIQAEVPEIRGIRITIRPVKEHRCAILLSGPGLSPALHENDPQKEGRPLKAIAAADPSADLAAAVLNEYLAKVEDLLKARHAKAGTILMRGFSKLPDLPTFERKYLLKAACIAAYPMYKGLATLVGMDIVKCGETLDEQLETLARVRNDYTFFFLHVKKTDAMGEDGNFAGKVKALEDIDRKIMQVRSLPFDAVAITGDHSTPAHLKGHSWHPVPLMVLSPAAIPDDISRFTERECSRGILGRMNSTELIYLLLACSMKLNKFGA